MVIATVRVSVSSESRVGHVSDGLQRDEFWDRKSSPNARGSFANQHALLRLSSDGMAKAASGLLREEQLR